MDKRTPQFFTLIELLVVIAIIAILASMLLPALQKAKYNAKVLDCLVHFKQYGVIIHSYAGDFDERYPFISCTGDRNTNGNRGLFKKGNYDGRIVLDGYVEDFNYLNCTFSDLKDVDYNTATSNQLGTTFEIWYGTMVKQNQPDSILERIGDVMVYNDGTENHEFNVLSADQLRYKPSGLSVMSAMPALELVPTSDNNPLRRFWGRNDGTPLHSPIDRNFLFDDGRAQTIRRLAVNDSRVQKLNYSTSSQSGALPTAE